MEPIELQIDSKVIIQGETYYIRSIEPEFESDSGLFFEHVEDDKLPHSNECKEHYEDDIKHEREPFCICEVDA